VSTKPLVPLAALAACLFGVALVALAARETPSDPTADPAEALLGSSYCNADANGAWSSLSFVATGNLVGDDFWGGRIPATGGSPGETCDLMTQAVTQALAGATCTRGPVESFDDENGAARSFQFSCSGPRSALVGVIAEIAAGLLRAGGS
jgi:hypothetical protein